MVHKELRRVLSLPVSQEHKEPGCWVASPTKKDTVRIDIVLAPTRTDFATETPAPQILAHWKLPNGDQVWIGKSIFETQKSVATTIVKYRGSEWVKLDCRDPWRSNRSDARMLIVGTNNNGYAFFIDAVASASVNSVKFRHATSKHKPCPQLNSPRRAC